MALDGQSIGKHRDRVRSCEKAGHDISARSGLRLFDPSTFAASLEFLMLAGGDVSTPRWEHPAVEGGTQGLIEHLSEGCVNVAGCPSRRQIENEPIASRCRMLPPPSQAHLG